MPTADEKPSPRNTDHSVTVDGRGDTAATTLPNPNPSGNFTKITQRIPVRIDVEQRGNMLRPGMLVEVKIYVD